MCTAAKTGSILAARIRRLSASFSLPCWARTVPSRLSAAALFGATFKIQLSCCSASAIRLSRISVAAFSRRAWILFVWAAAKGAVNNNSSKTMVVPGKDIPVCRAAHRLAALCMKSGSRVRQTGTSVLPLCHLLKFLLLNDALALFDSNDFVNACISHLVDGSARPVNLNQIYLRSLLESEWQSQIALRKITATTVNLIDLRQITGDDLDARANPITIALHSDHFDQH